MGGKRTFRLLQIAQKIGDYDDHTQKKAREEAYETAYPLISADPFVGRGQRQFKCIEEELKQRHRERA
jgi:hypothetical protein